MAIKLILVPAKLSHALKEDEFSPFHLGMYEKIKKSFCDEKKFVKTEFIGSIIHAIVLFVYQ